MRKLVVLAGLMAMLAVVPVALGYSHLRFQNPQKYAAYIIRKYGTAQHLKCRPRATVVTCTNHTNNEKGTYHYYKIGRTVALEKIDVCTTTGIIYCQKATRKNRHYHAPGF